MWNERITIGLVKPEQEPKDARDMRKAILDAARDSSLIRTAMDTARYMGLNGEDMYTLLAYHALRQLEHHAQLNLNFLNTMPAPSFVVRDPDKATGDL